MNASSHSSVVKVCNDLALDLIVEATDLASSYAISAREAAGRGDYGLLGAHLSQLRLSTVTALQAFKQHVRAPTGQTGRES